LVLITIVGYGIVRTNRHASATGGSRAAENITRNVNESSRNERDPALLNFQARCQSPGVLKCVDFDDDSWFQQGVYLYPAWDGVYRGTKDTSIKYSGTSSLRFEFPGRTPANGSGAWSIRFGKGFAENSSFYVQYRMRLNDVMAKTDWDKLVSSSWKQSIFHSVGATCANIEITTGRYGWNGVNGFPVIYTECGGSGMVTNKGIPPYKIQQGDYNCWYSQFNPSNCFFYPANEWLVFSYRITIGNWGKPNSTIQAWVARDGEKLRKWIDLANFVLNKDSDSSSYNSVTLLPYMAQKNMKVDHPTAYMWFDELIISTEAIPDPAGEPHKR